MSEAFEKCNFYSCVLAKHNYRVLVKVTCHNSIDNCVCLCVCVCVSMFKLPDNSKSNKSRNMKLG